MIEVDPELLVGLNNLNKNKQSIGLQNESLGLQQEILNMQKLQVLNQVRISKGLLPLIELPEPPPVLARPPPPPRPPRTSEENWEYYPKVMLVIIVLAYVCFVAWMFLFK